MTEAMSTVKICIIYVIPVVVKQWEDFDRHPLVDQATRLSYLLASFIQPWTSELSEYAKFGSSTS